MSGTADPAGTQAKLNHAADTLARIPIDATVPRLLPLCSVRFLSAAYFSAGRTGFIRRRSCGRYYAINPANFKPWARAKYRPDAHPQASGTSVQSECQ